MWCGAEHTLALCQEGVSVVSVVWGRAHTGSLSGRGECSQCGVGQSTHWFSLCQEGVKFKFYSLILPHHRFFLGVLHLMVR